MAKEKLPQVLATLTSVANQAVDIQLKLLQTLLSILTFNTDVHDDVLGNALLLCFKLQDSRVSVVSSTAAATLRQAVMLIFNRVSSSIPSTPTTIPLTLPSHPPQTVEATPSALDAFNIFSDLCLLAATAGSHGSAFSLWKGGDKEKPKLLKLNTLQRTFALELIESILSGYEDGVKKRPELLFLLQHSLHPLLLKLLAEKPTFPIALRVCRLIFLLIRSFIDQLPKENETYLVALVKLGTGDMEREEGKGKENTPPWLRVLALEILRGICGDYTLLQNIYTHYDKTEGPKLYNRIVSALSHLVNEKPALLGIGTQMHGLGVPATDLSSSNPNLHAAGYLDMGLGMVASAASVGVSTVNAMMGAGGGGLGSHSAMKLRLIEQHDKAEAPLIPETYIYLVALQSLDAIAEGIYITVASKNPPPAPLQDMASSAWPPLLAALSYCIGINLSDSLFAEVLTALQNFTVACGLLGLNTPRDALLNTLGKYAVPPPAVSAMQSYMEAPNAQRNSGGIAADALGFASSLGGGGPTGPPSLSERNLACLRSMVNTARVLGSTLGNAWHDVLEILQNANFMLATRQPSLTRKPTSGEPPKQTGELPETKPDILQDLDLDSIQVLINSLFDSSKDLSDEAFTTFITALCHLSSEMIGMESISPAAVDTASEVSVPSTGTALLSPSQDNNRRKTSGLNLSHSIKSGERSFSLTKLKVVSSLNLNRIVTKKPEIGWTAITQHLLAVARHLTAPFTIRIQASDTLGELLLSAVRVGKDSRIQHQVFEVLVHQVDVLPISNSISTDFDVRSAGYQTLNHLLESSGHSLQVGWETIFKMLDGVCQDQLTSGNKLSAEPRRPSVLSSKGNANLVRIAFPSLTLICNDFLTSLDGEAMRQCIACLGLFGRQKEDVNITLAAIGLLWTVSDAVQGDSKELWLYLLTELLGLGRDSRLEVRNSAMQTLFRCVELYGSGLSPKLWEDVFWKIIFPLLDDTQGEESQVLALTSVGSIFGSFLSSTIASLQSFDKIYQHFLGRIKHAFTDGPRACCTASLTALEKVLVSADANRTELGLVVPKIMDATWETFVAMGTSFPRGEPYTQDNLIALVQIGSLLHGNLSFNDSDKLVQLSDILRSIMTYARSPDFRPDVDVMSPLQSKLCQVIANSDILGPSLVLGDLAEFASLAYVGVGGQGTGSKMTYVALSKWSMSKMMEVFDNDWKEKELYEDGTVEEMLGAMTIVTKLLDKVMTTLDVEKKFESLWAQILEVFGGMLLAESSDSASPDDESFVIGHLTRLRTAVISRLGDTRVPDRVISQLSEVLSKSSKLYHYDVKSNGGTTAPGIATTQEALRYWAFDLLVLLATKGDKVEDTGYKGDKRVSQLALPSLVNRFEESMRRFKEDKKLRRGLPLGRARDDELLYILKHLATTKIWEGSLAPTGQASELLKAVYEKCPRSHLLQFYPLLLDLSFAQDYMPSLWVTLSEQAELLGTSVPELEIGREDALDEPGSQLDAEDEELVEVNAKDLAKRCLELIGLEMGLGDA
ncbi:hypothetical protein I305_00461 [Cryptococcus gattii E566]|uniref:Uncharacterized protein n=2 Tax=Cryptococcus gattii TaxID=37769 RepID=E6QYN9_CRYGW|nr:Hypothetical Protein CGB_A9040W [Cryptococcus gattii WM276]ADV19956.1 Hypothetical Protein CGB_A9040W [Cryptococcus gattii WM276]KIR79417.1 hypothetical protein I306_03536 [Cryptococcus gattii EJB2]KIY37363.1 hypothetical protein I305_00461 [Cryptococcus gattii E566]